MIDSTHLKAHRTAASLLKKGLFPAVSAEQRAPEPQSDYVHIDIYELRLAAGKLFKFLAIDRMSKFIHIAFLPAANRLTVQWPGCADEPHNQRGHDQAVGPNI